MYTYIMIRSACFMFLTRTLGFLFLPSPTLSDRFSLSFSFQQRSFLRAGADLRATMKSALSCLCATTSLQYRRQSLSRTSPQKSGRRSCRRVYTYMSRFCMLCACSTGCLSACDCLAKSQDKRSLYIPDDVSSITQVMTSMCVLLVLRTLLFFPRPQDANGRFYFDSYICIVQHETRNDWYGR